MANQTKPPVEATRSADSDYVDDLFDYDVGLDGILQETNTNTNNMNAPKQSAPPENSGVVLGLDEEVKVSKKRQPVAKLDENRLLTQAGIPKLRRSARRNLKFKGKGHEFSDLARLLNFYQLWLDDLFPKAKFADGLAMIERLGHSKRLQTMRRAWIDEEKPKSADDEPSDHPQASLNNNSTMEKDTEMTDSRHLISNIAPANMTVVDQSRTQLPPRDDLDEGLFIPDDINKQGTTNDDGAPLDDDDLDELAALLRGNEGELGAGNAVSTGTKHTQLGDNDLDELDALLREHEDEPPGIGNDVSTGAKHDPLETDSHADEMEAMEGLYVL
ncbi:replication fork protection component Swi3-domain-containing protein [Aspergillus cavernicola]|uniref:Chromosome segregation in meiosis protein n=1 Tax=Aspergillus cavernicola TaxID=176166 RepID=A0ABR4IX76_9EURO